MQKTACEVSRGQPQSLSWSVWLVPAGALLCLFPSVTSVMALIAGAALGLCGGNARPALAQRSAHWLLKISVIGLGAGMNLVAVARAGLDGLGITVCSISATLLLGLWLGRKMGVSRDLSLLLSGGTAICGGSAIAALSGAIRPKAEDTAVALAVIFLLNGLALIVFPPVGHYFGLTQHQFGWWAALGIHDTSSVTGAGLVYGAEALELATIIKLARALWIVPLVFAAAHFFRPASQEGVPAQKGKIKLPWFIAGFVAMAALFTWWPAASPVAHAITLVSQRLLVATLFIIGAGFTRKALCSVGPRPLLLAVILWIVVAGGSLLVISQR